jgi:hypothetical protein
MTYDRYFYGGAALVGATAAAQAILALTGEPGALVAAVCSATVAAGMVMYPHLRTGWWEAGYEAGTLDEREQRAR